VPGLVLRHVAAPEQPQSEDTLWNQPETIGRMNGVSAAAVNGTPARYQTLRAAFGRAQAQG